VRRVFGFVKENHPERSILSNSRAVFGPMVSAQ
jgi:hypothetical protein